MPARVLGGQHGLCRLVQDCLQSEVGTILIALAFHLVAKLALSDHGYFNHARYSWSQLERTGDRGDGLVTLVKHGIGVWVFSPNTHTNASIQYLSETSFSRKCWVTKPHKWSSQKILKTTFLLASINHPTCEIYAGPEGCCEYLFVCSFWSSSSHTPKLFLVIYRAFRTYKARRWCYWRALVEKLLHVQERLTHGYYFRRDRRDIIFRDLGDRVAMLLRLQIPSMTAPREQNAFLWFMSTRV